MDQEPKGIVLDGYNIILSCGGDLSLSTTNKKIGKHERDGCPGDVYLFREKSGSRIMCGNWSAVGRCRLLHEVEEDRNVSTFEKLIAYAESLQ